jgi:hypothetical protein
LIEPTLEACAESWQNDLVIGKFNVESNNDNLKIELLLQGVMPRALPALILVHDNKVVTTWKGVIRPNELESMLLDHVIPGRTNKKGVSATMTSATTTTSMIPKRKSGLISFSMMNDDADDYMLKAV